MCVKDIVLGKLKRFLRHEPCWSPDIINLDVVPFCRESWAVLPDSEQLPNRIRGQWKFDPKEIKLHLAEGQKNGKCMKGHDLKKDLDNQPVLNANVLDFLLKHPELIPEEWKSKAVFFWGTIYRGYDRGLCVRYLIWRDTGWGWGALWFDDEWGDGNPAAIRAF